MRNLKVIILFVLILSLLAGCASKDDIKENENNIEFPDEVMELSKEFVLDLLSERYDEVVAADLDPKMQLTLTEDLAKSIYVELISRCGFFNKIEEVVTTIEEDFGVITYICKFDLIHVNMKVYVDNDMRIAGLNYTFNKTYESAEINELSVSFGFEFEIFGALTKPEVEHDVPLVIIVGGSGPIDRNGVVGATTPYYDIAMELYTRDIAVLRYDKRTLTHNEYISNNLDGFTLWDETIDDAAMAFFFAQSLDGIDKDNIYFVGHSLGGYAMGRISLLIQDAAAGYILLAPNASPLEDLIIDQVEYLNLYDGEVSDDEAAVLANYITQRDSIKELTYDSEKTFVELLNAPKSYWLDLKNYDPVVTMAESTKPILILQGERDYQVDMEEYQIWVDGLADNELASFESYRELNHVFTAGVGKSSPEEYSSALSIDPRVIEAIADFIAE